LPCGADTSAPRKRLPSRGVVLSHGMFLGPSEIKSLRVVPELVFLNCCHLGGRASDDVLGTATWPRVEFNRAEFAASLADALIGLGVRCVVAAGWAVEEEAARAFAATFYSALMRNERFIDAVAAAREAALNAGDEGDNTWAAYQCYGDPDWRFRRQAGDPQRPSSSSGTELAGVASTSALKLALYTLAVRSANQGAKPGEQRRRLLRLEKRFKERWGSVGAVAEAFGTAWSELGDLQKAIEWYERAYSAADGSATLRAAEQLANLRARLAWETVDQAAGVPEAAAGSSTKAQASPELAAATTTARSEIGKSRELLEKLLAIQLTAERENLLGSAFKRLAMVEMSIGHHEAADAAVEEMVRHYEQAAKLVSREPGSDISYPYLNCLAADVERYAGRADWPGLEGPRLIDVEQELVRRNRDRPDFWSKAGVIELSMYKALAARALAEHRSEITKAYTNLHACVPATRFWSSVFDQARFVLWPYASAAAEDERAAANAVLEQLNKFRTPDSAGRGRRKSGC
jgi:tetratricopeptide (TPR) repeat protein